MTKSKTKAGFVSIIGAPNAGKSTLLNRLIGQKLSIVSPKAQTTRIRTLGILSEGDTQIAFADTPGIFSPKSKTDKSMVNAAWASVADTELILVIADARRDDEKVSLVIEGLQKLKLAGKKNVILALNKVDDVQKDRLLPLAKTLNETGLFSEIVMISALTGEGVKELKDYIIGQMPLGPWFYDEDQITDLPSAILAAEITREQLFFQLQDELPYYAAVIPDSFAQQKDGSLLIHQSIIVTRESHKPIVIGSGGARIKSIGQKARQEISKVFDCKVHLFLNVKFRIGMEN
ncbi:MAG: GTPase Era [Alphaproteobacteria bacterium]|nr:GTPase Era [Alphaproteobacteria bacterium]